MLKSLVRSLFQQYGYEIHRISKTTQMPSDPFDIQRKLLTTMGITSPTIFDVGGHKGQTIKRYKSKFPESMIYCFEAFPASVEVLNQSFQNDEKVKIIPLAIADKPEEKTFYVNNYDATNSLFPRNITTRRYYPSYAGPKSTIQVMATTIDAFVQTQSVKTIDILKLDIQGGELMAFKGAIQTLKERNVSLIYTETYFTPHYEETPLLYQLWEYLNGFGYTIFDIYDTQRANNGQLRFADVLFVSEQIRKNVLDKFSDEP